MRVIEGSPEKITCAVVRSSGRQSGRHALLCAPAPPPPPQQSRGSHPRSSRRPQKQQQQQIVQRVPGHLNRRRGGSSAPAPRLISSASVWAAALQPHQLELGSGGTAEQGDWRRQPAPWRTVRRPWLPFVRRFASLIADIVCMQEMQWPYMRWGKSTPGQWTHKWSGRDKWRGGRAGGAEGHRMRKLSWWWR